jgi:hypothetical protein
MQGKLLMADYAHQYKYCIVIYNRSSYGNGYDYGAQARRTSQEQAPQPWRPGMQHRIAAMLHESR